MANYQKIIELRPEFRDFLRHRRWTYRGDVLAYQPEIRCDSFSTDAMGFRHSTFRGETLSVNDCMRRERYGLVLGASNIFGFGVGGNENLIPSLLAEQFGFPFANIGMPAGNSRNLYTFLLSVVLRRPRAPAVVVHYSGGDYSAFCFSSQADAVFGSPNRKQLQSMAKERPAVPNPDEQLPGLLGFTTLWTTTIHRLCRRRKIPLVLGNDTTFFEKKKPTAVERDSELGKPFIPPHHPQFANHRKFGDAFYSRRKAVADKLKVPLAGWGLAEDISFVDEFHPDRDGMRVLAEPVAKAIEPLL